MGYLKKLKSAGKADTNHHEEIPAASEEKIMDLIRNLQTLLDLEDKATLEYQEAVDKLPEDFQDSYQHLLQYCCMYLFMSSFAKRGREGIDLIEKTDFLKKYDEEDSYYYWQRVVIRFSKNHK